MPEKLKVKPRKFPLDGKGTWWELHLAERGWNNLPEADRIGYMNDTFDVFFPALNITENVFPDEVWFIKDESGAATDNQAK